MSVKVGDRLPDAIAQFLYLVVALAKPTQSLDVGQQLRGLVGNLLLKCSLELVDIVGRVVKPLGLLGVLDGGHEGEVVALALPEQLVLILLQRVCVCHVSDQGTLHLHVLFFLRVKAALHVDDLGAQHLLLFGEPGVRVSQILGVVVGGAQLVECPVVLLTRLDKPGVGPDLWEVVVELEDAFNAGFDVREDRLVRPTLEDAVALEQQ